MTLICNETLSTFEINMICLGIEQQLSEMITYCGDSWDCLKCGKKAKTKQHIKNHAEIHIADYCNFCPICGKSFKTSNTLKNHVSLKHKNLPIM